MKKWKVSLHESYISPKKLILSVTEKRTQQISKLLVETVELKRMA